MILTLIGLGDSLYYVSMQHLRFLLFILTLSFLLPACGEVTGNPDSRFVPVEPLIEEQIKLLTSLNLKVEKQVRTDQGTETKIFSNINWQKELSAFRVADISKPGLQGAYMIESPEANVRIFRLKEDQNAEVQILKIELGENGRIKSLEATVDDQNYLYHTRRTFRINFDRLVNGQYTVSAYQIAGAQKLIWSKENPFSVRAKIL